MGQSDLGQSLSFPKGFFSLFCYSLIISTCHTKNTFCHSSPYIHGVLLFKICSTYFKNRQIFNKKQMKFHSSCFRVLRWSNFLESVLNLFKVDVYVSFPEVIMISWDSQETTEIRLPVVYQARLFKSHGIYEAFLEVSIKERWVEHVLTLYRNLSPANLFK